MLLACSARCHSGKCQISTIALRQAGPGHQAAFKRLKTNPDCGCGVQRRSGCRSLMQPGPGEAALARHPLLSL